MHSYYRAIEAGARRDSLEAHRGEADERKVIRTLLWEERSAAGTLGELGVARRIRSSVLWRRGSRNS